MDKLALQFELKLKGRDRRPLESRRERDHDCRERDWLESEWKLSPHSWIQLWDAESGKEKFTIRLKGPV